LWDPAGHDRPRRLPARRGPGVDQELTSRPDRRLRVGAQGEGAVASELGGLRAHGARRVERTVIWTRWQASSTAVGEDPAGEVPAERRPDVAVAGEQGCRPSADADGVAGGDGHPRKGEDRERHRRFGGNADAGAEGAGSPVAAGRVGFRGLSVLSVKAGFVGDVLQLDGDGRGPGRRRRCQWVRRQGAFARHLQGLPQAAGLAPVLSVRGRRARHAALSRSLPSPV